MTTENATSDVEMDFLDILMKEEGGAERGDGVSSPLPDSFGHLEPLPFHSPEEGALFEIGADEDTKGSCADETNKKGNPEASVHLESIHPTTSVVESRTGRLSSDLSDGCSSSSSASNISGAKRSRSELTTRAPPKEDDIATKKSFGTHSSSQKKKRGRRCSKLLSREEKRKLRLIRNRRSAQLHRDKKKAFIEGLENKVKQLTAANESLEKRVAKLLEENKRLRQRLGSSRHRSPSATRDRRASANSMETSTDILPDVMSDSLFHDLDKDLINVSTSGSFVHVGDDNGEGFTSDSSANTMTPPSSPGPKGFLMLFAFACSFVLFGSNLIPTVSQNFDVAFSNRRMLVPGFVTSSVGVVERRDLALPHGRPTGRVLMGVEESAAVVLEENKEDDDEGAHFFQSFANHQVEKLASSSSLVQEANRHADDDKAIALWRGAAAAGETRSETLAVIRETERDDRDAIFSAVELLRSKGIPLLLDVSPSSSETLKISLDDDAWAMNGRARAVIDSFVAAYTTSSRKHRGNSDDYATMSSKNAEGRNTSLILCPQAHGIIASPDIFLNDVSRSSDSTEGAATSRALRVSGRSASPRLRQGRIAGSENVSVDSHNNELMVVVPSDTLHWGKWGNVRRSDETDLYEIRCRMDSVKPMSVSV